MMITSLFALQIAFSTPASSFPEIPSLESEIPIQVPLSHSRYQSFFEKASESVSENSNECAKFVNRLFLARFGKMMFGSAWTLQLKPENKEFLDLVWQLKEDQFDRSNNFSLYHYTDRIDHFEKLYNLLDNDEHPIGVLGFLYHFSGYKEVVASHPEWLPQTHVAFLAGRTSFTIQNTTTSPQTIEQILVAEHGQIHDFEREFLKKRIRLDIELLPGSTYTYNDYLVEEHFRKPMKGSLLELFLRKHRNNRTTPLLRPVSYSRIVPALIRQMKNQEKVLQEFGSMEFVSGKEFEMREFPHKKEWEKLLSQYFSLSDPDKALVVPVPQNPKVVFSDK